MDSHSYRTPLGRARGLGSAHTGVARFISERATSVALVPLSLWAIYAGLKIAPLGYDGAVAFLQSPLNAVLAVLLIAVSVSHMDMGMRVIIEDYIHKPLSKVVLLLLSTGVSWTFGALGIVSVLKVALMSAGAH
jgi:succinate dehydrogenase / fumarate reductase membrane anchor subunit